MNIKHTSRVSVWCWLLACNIVDVYATEHLLTRGYKEMNPVSDWIIINWNFTGLLFVKLTFIVALMSVYFWWTKRIYKYIAGATIIYTMLFIYQIYLIYN